jgi:hypothetical protein
MKYMNESARFGVADTQRGSLTDGKIFAWDKLTSRGKRKRQTTFFTIVPT